MPIFKGSVALTGLNATDNPGPGVAVARAASSVARKESISPPDPPTVMTTFLGSTCTP